MSGIDEDRDRGKEKGMDEDVGDSLFEIVARICKFFADKCGNL